MGGDYDPGDKEVIKVIEDGCDCNNSNENE